MKVDRKLQVTVRFQGRATVRFQGKMTGKHQERTMGRQHQERVITNLSQHQQRREKYQVEGVEVVEVA